MRTRSSDHSRGSWIFGTAWFLFFVAVFFFGPERLPFFRQRMLAVAAALLSGLFVYFLVGEIKIIAGPWNTRWGKVSASATGGVAVFITVLFWWVSPLTPVSYEDKPSICSDEYLALRIPSLPAGPFYNPDGYDIRIEIQNKQGMNLLVSGVHVLFSSAEVIDRVKAFQVLGAGTGSVYYSSDFEGPFLLPPNGARTLKLRGPRFLPRELEILIYHSASRGASVCRFVIPTTGPPNSKPLAKNIYHSIPAHSGLDGLDAIKRAISAAPSRTPRVISCLPASKKTSISSEGLYINEVSEWLVLFEDSTAIFIAEDKKEIKTIALDRSRPLLAVDPKLISIGTGEALRLVNEAGLIRGSSPEDWFLFAGRHRGVVIPIWRLPYIGSDYLNLFVSARSGEILPSAEYFRNYAPLETGSTTRETSKDSPQEESGKEEKTDGR